MCVLCYEKGKRNISEKVEEYIKTNLIDGFSKDNLDFPSALCNGCYLLLHNKMTGKEANLPHVHSYDLERPQMLRDSECNCKICKLQKQQLTISLIRKNGAILRVMKHLT